MIIQVNNEYRIGAEPLNYTLQRSRVVKEGENKGTQVWDVVGYFPDLKMTYRNLIKRDLLEKDLRGIKEVVEHLDKLHNDILESIKQMKG